MTETRPAASEQAGHPASCAFQAFWQIQTFLQSGQSEQQRGISSRGAGFFCAETGSAEGCDPNFGLSMEKDGAGTRWEKGPRYANRDCSCSIAARWWALAVSTRLIPNDGRGQICC